MPGVRIQLQGSRPVLRNGAPEPMIVAVFATSRTL